MAFIRLLDRDIAPEALGFTYSHEHIYCSPPYWEMKGEDDLLMDDLEKSRKEVEIFKAAGGKTIVDATAIDYGRRVQEVYGIAQQTGIQIVGTAGFNKGFLWTAPRRGMEETFEGWIRRSSVDDLTRFVVQEVEEGMEGTSLRGGQVKFGTGYNSITDLEEKTIRAVAQAHHQTGAPVHSHTEAGTMALEQIDILKSEHINLAYVSFGHMDRNLDTWMHRKVAETGAFLCFDGIGKAKYGPECARTKAILDLVRAGHRKQILISGDIARKSYCASYGFGLGMGFIISKWIPRFIEEAEEAGLDGQSLVDDFFLHNPARCFTFKSNTQGV